MAVMYGSVDGTGLAVAQCTILMENLPNEALVHIFRYLAVADLTDTVPLVCKRWAEILSHENVWKDMLQARYGNLPAKAQLSRGFRHAFLHQSDALHTWRYAQPSPHAVQIPQPAALVALPQAASRSLLFSQLHMNDGYYTSVFAKGSNYHNVTRQATTCRVPVYRSHAGRRGFALLHYSGHASFVDFDQGHVICRPDPMRRIPAFGAEYGDAGRFLRSPPVSVAFGTSGRALAVLLDERRVLVASATLKEPLQWQPGEASRLGAVRELALVEGETDLVLALLGDASILEIYTHAGELIKTVELDPDDGEVTRLEACTGHLVVYTPSRLLILDTQTWKPHDAFRAPMARVTASCLNVETATFVMGDASGNLIARRLTTPEEPGRQMWYRGGLKGEIHYIDVTDSVVVAGSTQDSVYAWCSLSGTHVRTFKASRTRAASGHARNTRTVSVRATGHSPVCHRDGRLVLSNGAGTTLYWDLTHEGLLPANARQQEESPIAVGGARSGRSLAAAIERQVALEEGLAVYQDEVDEEEERHALEASLSIPGLSEAELVSLTMLLSREEAQRDQASRPVGGQPGGAFAGLSEDLSFLTEEEQLQLALSESQISF